jgi:SAM-dependent methyltransferase
VRTAGVRRIVAFNWPKLAGAGAVVLAGVAVQRTTAGRVGVAGLLAAVGTAYFLLASLGVSWWVYDRSELHQWAWLRPEATGQRPWALVHAGFDEAGASLATALGPPQMTVDISRLVGRPSPSLRRARHLYPAGPSVSADPRLPLASNSCSNVVLAFVAHEVRDRERREALFDELRRVVTPNGQVVLVEHVRDGANIAAFGPGAWHFQPRGEWQRLAERSGFDAAEVKLGAFVRGFVLCTR